MAAVSGQMMGELEYEHRKKNEEMYAGVKGSCACRGREEEEFSSVVGPRHPPMAGIVSSPHQSPQNCLRCPSFF
jgi:hypothetical protein